MVTQVSATEARAKFYALLTRAQAAENVITKRGVPFAMLKATRNPRALRGLFSGIVTSTATDEELFSTGEWNLN